MKKFSITSSHIFKQVILVGILVVGSVVLAAPVQNPDTSDVPPLLNVGNRAQTLKGALVVTGNNTAFDGVLLQLGGNAVSHFEPGTSTTSDLMVRTTALFGSKLVLASQFPDATKNLVPWGESYSGSSGTIQLSSIPELVVEQDILSASVAGSSSQRELCVSPAGVITSCGSPVCEAYPSSYSTQPASDDATGCSVGSYAEASDTAAAWKWSCSDGGVTVSCSANKPLANGSCKSYTGVHNSQPATDDASGCTSGQYSDIADSTSSWLWHCEGVNGGTSATSCNATRPTVDGVCNASATSGSYGYQPASDSASGCTVGVYQDISDSASQWKWNCLGSNGGATASCAATIQVENGACVSYTGTYVSPPATNTASGCSSGSYQIGTTNDSKWTWNCIGSLGGSSASCEADKELAACKSYTQYQNYSSQPATDTASGCTVGSYVDTADITDQYIYHPNQNIDTFATGYNWECRHGSTTGQNKTCSVFTTKINGSCKSYSSSYSSQPATNNTTGCASGYYVDVSDSSTEYKWRCLGRNSGSNANTCSAAKQAATPVDICTGSHCIYYCAGDSSNPTGNFSWQVLQTNTAAYTNAPTPFVAGNCDPNGAGVSGNLSQGLSNCNLNSSGLCSDSFLNIPQYDAERYFCGQEDPGFPAGEAIEIWDASGAPGSPAIMSAARCESI